MLSIMSLFIGLLGIIYAVSNGLNNKKYGEMVTIILITLVIVAVAFKLRL